MAEKIRSELPVIAPPEWEDADVLAVQALALGKAAPEQQQRALNWIIWSAAQTYEVGYRTDTRDHAFVSGRRFVGLQLVKMLKLNLMAINKKVSEL